MPFAYAMAALITGDLSARWVEHADRVAVFSFIFLTIGMVLGAVWAYVVLGWGGFWAWDAVENASFMSWLTAIAMIHSFTLYRRRGAFKRWSLFAATITFIFVVLGTFITRSGLVQSVHAFAEDAVSTYFFLGIMVAAALAFLLLLLYRNASLAEDDEIESLVLQERIVLHHQPGLHRGRVPGGLPHRVELAAHLAAARRAGGSRPGSTTRWPVRRRLCSASSWACARCWAGARPMEPRSGATSASRPSPASWCSRCSRSTSCSSSCPPTTP